MRKPIAMRSFYFIERDGVPVAASLDEWGVFCASEARIVKSTDTSRGLRVRTIFEGIDIYGDGHPRLYATGVFYPPKELTDHIRLLSEVWRDTRTEALDYHESTVAAIEEGWWRP